MKKRIALIVSLLLLVSILSCGTTKKIAENDATSIAAEVQQGQTYLKDNQMEEAKHSFEAVLSEDPENADAHFGIAISELIWIFQTLSTQAIAIQELPFAPGREQSRNEELVAVVQALLTGLDTSLGVIKSNLDALKTRDGLALKADSIPVSLLYADQLRFSGTLDRYDVMAIVSVAELLKSLFSFLNAHDLSFDFLNLLAYSSSLGSDGAKMSKLIAYLAVNNPNFLALHADTGQALLDESRALFAESATDLMTALDGMKARVGKDTSNLFRYDADANALIMHNGKVAKDGVALYDLTIPLMENLSTKLTHLTDNLNLTSGTLPIDLIDELLPYLAMYILGAARSFDLSKLGISIGGIDLANDLLTPDVVSKTIRGLFLPIPSSAVGFDFGYFLKHSQGLRQLLPKTQSVSTVGSATAASEFEMSWECPTGSAGYPMNGANTSLTCAKTGVTLTDGAHFSGTDSLALDGIASRFPYFIFTNPSLDSLIYLNESKLLGSGTDTLVPATNFLLNGLIAKVSAGL